MPLKVHLPNATLTPSDMISRRKERDGEKRERIKPGTSRHDENPRPDSK